MILWAYLEPCDIRRYPQITRFQAMTSGKLEPMSKMSQWEWKQTMLRGCEMIDEFLKDLEAPTINPHVIGKEFPRIANVPLLAKPARRRVEVLVYSRDKKWWRQSGINPGGIETKVHLGNDSTKKGTAFTIVALTTEQPLQEQTYLNLPDYRTKSSDITLLRG